MAPGYTASEQASSDAANAAAADVEPTTNASASTAGNERMYEFDCPIRTYAAEEGMDRAESESFTEEIADRLVEDMEAGGDKDVGNILDDMGVPAHDDLCG